MRFSRIFRGSWQSRDLPLTNYRFVAFEVPLRRLHLPSMFSLLPGFLWITLQRYELFIAVYECFPNFFFRFLRFFSDYSQRCSVIALQSLTSSTTTGARHSWCKHHSALAVAVVAVLQFSRSYSHTLKNFYIYIYIYIYINIELIFDFHITYFGTATLQHCNT